MEIIAVRKSLLLVPVTFLPVINPLSTAPIFVSTVGGDHTLAARLAMQVALHSCFSKAWGLWAIRVLAHLRMRLVER